jgi:hypothetical protein
VGYATGHLTQRAEALLLDHGLLGPAQFIVGFLGPLGQAYPIVEALAFFLRGDDLGLQGVFLQADSGDFRAHQFRAVTNLLQNEHDHAHGDEKLQHRRDKKAGTVKVVVLLGKRVAAEVKAPQQKTQGQHARAHECLLLAQPKKAHSGKKAAQTQQNEHGQFDLQQAWNFQRTDDGPDHQK